MRTIVLCADRMSLEYPITLGLSDEQPVRQPWLQITHSGPEVRSLIRSYSHDVELWVASSDDVSPINIAAMVKQENPNCTVCLVEYGESSGSTKSRASQARIDYVWTPAEFLEHYRAEKQRYMSREDDDADRFGGDGKGDGGIGGHGEKKRFDAQPPEEESSAPTRLLSPSEIDSMRTTVDSAKLNPLKLEPVKPQAKEPADPRERECASLAQSRNARAADNQAGAKKKASIISVVSGSGGSGKSTVSVLMALLSQMKGYKTLLIDADMQFGDVAFMLGSQQVVRLDEVVSVPAKLDQLKCQPAMPAILGAPLFMEQTEDVAASLADVLDAVSERFDVIVANTGSFWADQHIALLERSSTALFLVDQRPSSLRACKHALELCARCGIASSPFVAVANRCQKGALYTSIDVSCALRSMSAKELREGGSEVEELLSTGQVGDLIKSKNELCLSIDELLKELLAERADEETVEVFDDQKAHKGVLGLFRKKVH